MKFSKFSELVNRILSNNHRHRRDMDVTIVVHSPGSIGSTPSVEVQSIHAGFDWDSGKVLIFPTQPLTTLTPEQREELNKQIVELVRLNGRGTVRQLADETGISRCAVSRLSRELAASGDLYISGSGIFLSAQARKDWQNARKKLSRVKPKKSVVVDPDLIWSLPDGEIRRYDRRLNMICHDCRKSEVMQRVLAFYQGNFQEVA